MSELHNQVVAWMRSRPDITASGLSAHTTLGKSTVNNYLNGRQPETERIRSEMARVMLLIKQGDILQPGGGRALVLTEEHAETVGRVVMRSQFYETETVRRIAQILEYCRDQATIGVVTGNYGCGKTEAVNAWRRGAGRTTEAIIFEFSIFSSSNIISFIQELAEGLGLPSACGTSYAVKIFRAIVNRLREHPSLLLFDQAEMARPNVLQAIRQIHDRTRAEGVGVVLLAAPVLLAHLEKSRAEDLGAVSSRIGVWASLEGVTRNEMASILKAEGIVNVDEAAFDLWWKATGRSMRRLIAAIDLVKARHAGKRITEKTVEGIAGNLWGMTVHDREAA